MKPRHSTKYPLQSLSLSPDQRLVVVGGRDILQLIRVEPGEAAQQSLVNEELGAVPNLSEDNDPSKLRVFSRAGSELEQSLASLITTYPGMDDYDSHRRTPSKDIQDSMAASPTTILYSTAKAETTAYHFAKDRHLKTGSMALNYNGNHVAFHPQRPDIIATGSTKGAVVVWNLEKKGKKAARSLSTEHTRTVTRVDWHPTTPWMLASGSIDGTVKIWDTRRDGKKFKASTNIKPKSSAVRDTQYNPHDGNIVACAFDNGQVQLWDVRSTRTCLKKFAAHHGYVLTLDWHPSEPRVLASGGRDGQIKIWNTGAFGGGNSSQMKSGVGNVGGHEQVGRSSSDSGSRSGSSERSAQIQVIQTLASVACVKWRSSSHPQQLASSSTVVDPTINVWDVRHPYVPIACFDGHRSAVTDLAWVQHPYTNGKTQLISCSTDHDLVAHPLSTGYRPIEDASTTAIAVAPRGGFATFTSRVPTDRRHDDELNPLGYVVDDRNTFVGEENGKRSNSRGNRKRRNEQSDRNASSKNNKSVRVGFVRTRKHEEHMCTPHHNYTFGIDYRRFKRYAELYRFELEDDEQENVVHGNQKSKKSVGIGIDPPLRTAAEVCEHNGKVATMLGCRIRTQAWSTLVSTFLWCLLNCLYV